MAKNAKTSIAKWLCEIRICALPAFPNKTKKRRRIWERIWYWAIRSNRSSLVASRIMVNFISVAPRSCYRQVQQARVIVLTIRLVDSSKWASTRILCWTSAQVSSFNTKISPKWRYRKSSSNGNRMWTQRNRLPKTRTKTWTTMITKRRGCSTIPRSMAAVPN